LPCGMALCASSGENQSRVDLYMKQAPTTESSISAFMPSELPKRPVPPLHRICNTRFDRFDPAANRFDLRVIIYCTQAVHRAYRPCVMALCASSGDCAPPRAMVACVLRVFRQGGCNARKDHDASCTYEPTCPYMHVPTCLYIRHTYMSIHSTPFRRPVRVAAVYY
jgi:hypothetical protein